MPDEGGFAGHPKKRIRVFWGPWSRPYKNHQRTSSHRVELGRDVSHLRKRRIKELAGNELLRVGQRFVRPPLPRCNHGLAARFQNLAKEIGRKLGSKRIVQLLPDPSRLLLVID